MDSVYKLSSRYISISSANIQRNNDIKRLTFLLKFTIQETRLVPFQDEQYLTCNPCNLRIFHTKINLVQTCHFNPNKYCPNFCIEGINRNKCWHCCFQDAQLSNIVALALDRTVWRAETIRTTKGHLPPWWIEERMPKRRAFVNCALFISLENLQVHYEISLLPPPIVF